MGLPFRFARFLAPWRKIESSRSKEPSRLHENRHGTGRAWVSHRTVRTMSIVQSEIIERFGSTTDCSPTASDGAYRRLLREFLTAQIGFERAQNLRQRLLVALTATSLILWVFSVWPESLGHPVRSMSLGVWLLLFTAVLYAWV